MLTQERQIPTQTNDPILTQVAFTRLLRWLDDGIDSEGESYLEMRRRLAAYFDRRGRYGADGLADETLNRIGRTLEKAGAIATTPPARYCYVVARFVLLEDIRRARREVPFDDTRGERPDGVAPEDDEARTSAAREQRLDCLDRCLSNLKPDQRRLVLEYYHDAKRQRIERRRDLAGRLGITMNALGIRLSRLRGNLETCMRACCSR